MSNETMPEKIWASGEKEGYLFIPKFIGFASDELTPYTRADTIPSRAQVARALLYEAEERYETGDYISMSDAIAAVIKEWEEADAKQAKPW